MFPKIADDPTPTLRSANFDIDVDQFSNKPSDYYNITSLLSNTSLGAYQRLLNSLSNKGIQISVDYSDYSNFIHFSSAKERLLNFVYKLETIEGYNRDMTSIRTVPNYSSSYNTSQSVYVLQEKVNNVVTNFDGYESYLYYQSESAAWPKSNSTPPYNLYNTTSSQALTWLGSEVGTSIYYGGMMYTASSYDNENPNNLVYSIPEFIAEDPTNDQYALFLDMIGQHFDNVWLYSKAITDQYNATNDIKSGISKDLVYYALRSLGVKLYNSKSNENIFNYLIGATDSGSYTAVTSSYATTVSASAYIVPGQDLQKELLNLN